MLLKKSSKNFIDTRQSTNHIIALSNIIDGYKLSVTITSIFSKKEGQRTVLHPNLLALYLTHSCPASPSCRTGASSVICSTPTTCLNSLPHPTTGCGIFLSFSHHPDISPPFSAFCDKKIFPYFPFFSNFVLEKFSSMMYNPFIKLQILEETSWKTR